MRQSRRQRPSGGDHGRFESGVAEHRDDRQQRSCGPGAARSTPRTTRLGRRAACQCPAACATSDGVSLGANATGMSRRVTIDHERADHPGGTSRRPDSRRTTALRRSTWVSTRSCGPATTRSASCGAAPTSQPSSRRAAPQPGAGDRTQARRPAVSGSRNRASARRSPVPSGVCAPAEPGVAIICASIGGGFGPGSRLRDVLSERRSSGGCIPVRLSAARWLARAPRRRITSGAPDGVEIAPEPPVGVPDATRSVGGVPSDHGPQDLATPTSLQAPVGEPAVSGLLSNAGALVVSRLVVAVLGWAGTIFVIRNLTPTEWGQFSFVFSVLGMLSFITALGSNRVVLARLARRSEDRGAFAGAYVVLRLLLGLVAYVLALAFVWLAGYPEAVLRTTALAGVVLVIGAGSSGLDVIFQSELKLGVVATATVIGQLAQLALTVAVALTVPTLLWFVVPAIFFDLVGAAWKLRRVGALLPVQYVVGSRGVAVHPRPSRTAGDGGCSGCGVGPHRRGPALQDRLVRGGRLPGGGGQVRHGGGVHPDGAHATAAHPARPVLARGPCALLRDRPTGDAVDDGRWWRSDGRVRPRRDRPHRAALRTALHGGGACGGPHRRSHLRELLRLHRRRGAGGEGQEPGLRLLRARRARPDRRDQPGAHPQVLLPRSRGRPARHHVRDAAHHVLLRAGAYDGPRARALADRRRGAVCGCLHGAGAGCCAGSCPGRRLPSSRSARTQPCSTTAG